MSELFLNLPEDNDVDPRIEKPNTIYHVGVSGGKDSTAVLLWMIFESGIDWKKIKVSFCDTRNEHDWTYAHIKMLSEKVFPIETIQPALGFFDLALDKQRFPSACARFCTEHLKIIPTEIHIAGLRCRGHEVIAVSGVRADESEERSHLKEWGVNGLLHCFQWRPLISWTIDDVLKIHEKYGVPLNPLYALGAQRVGCWPCIMSNKEEIRTIAIKFPERIDAIRKAEQEFEKQYGRYSTFFGPNIVPPRFRSRLDPESGVMVATIDDVVRWSMTGKRAKGHWTDDPVTKKIQCNSGFCE